jgi:hypothetical protein
MSGKAAHSPALLVASQPRLGAQPQVVLVISDLESSVLLIDDVTVAAVVNSCLAAKGRSRQLVM